MLLLLRVFSRCRFSRSFAPGGRAAWLVKALKSPGVDTRHETRDRIQETQDTRHETRDNFQTIFGQVADNVRTCLENFQIIFKYFSDNSQIVVGQFSDNFRTIFRYFLDIFDFFQGCSRSV